MYFYAIKAGFIYYDTIIVGGLQCTGFSFIGCIPLSKREAKLKNQANFFCVRQVYFTVILPTKVNSTMRRCCYNTDLGQNAVFHNFAFIQNLGRSNHALSLDNILHN